MSKLADRIEAALQETRILILGAQVLLGVQFTEVFQRGFGRLPASAQYLKAASLVMLALALGLLLAPAAYHRIVEGMQSTTRFHSFVSTVTCVGLLPFAWGLAVDVGVAALGSVSSPFAISAGGVMLGLALFSWYGLETVVRRRNRRSPRDKAGTVREDASVEEKIDHALTEARMVLPGAQALLGFQTAIVLTDAFESLPMSSKLVHLSCIVATALSTIVLMTPAAYHRIVEEGRPTDRFQRLAGICVLASMVPLAIAISGELFVVVTKITGSAAAAVVTSALLLLFFFGFWFGLTFWLRLHRHRR
jgi:hypothetical protein